MEFLVAHSTPFEVFGNILKLVLPWVAGLALSYLAIRAIVRSLNRRDDPRRQKPPADAP